MNLVSIIMPVYNVEDYLERSIMSIINQTYSNWELFLINDGSKDKSGTICDDYANKDNRIYAIHQENKGSGLARQEGLDNANGKYICFVDPDDYLEKDALNNNVNIINQYEVDIVANSYYELRKKSNNKVKKIKNEVLLNGFYTKKEFRENYSYYKKVGDRTLWNKLYRNQFLKENKIKFSDLPVGEDGEFNYKAYEKLNSIYVDDAAYYVYDTTREDSAVKKYRKNRLEIELKLVETHKVMFVEWDMYEKYEYIILLELFEALIYSMGLLFSTSNDLEFTEKLNTIKYYASREIFLRVFDNLNIYYIDSLHLKILFFLLKNKQYLIVGSSYGIRSFVKRMLN